MGQKIHPVGLRLGITRTWESRWFEKKNYKLWLHEDSAIRKYFGRLTRAAAISKVEIERRANQARVIVHTAKPGIIIGKRGVGIEDIRKNLEHLTQKAVQVNVVEIKHPELDARLVGQNIVDQLEKRIAFRRAMKQAIMRTMKAGARGVKVMVSGRLGGAEIARSEQNHDGKVPLHTLRADIDYAHVEAFTTFGRIGVKVWIYKGEVLPDTPRLDLRAQQERVAGERATFRDRRNDRRGGRGRGTRPEGAAEASVAPATPASAEGELEGQALASENEGAPPIEAATVSETNALIETHAVTEEARAEAEPVQAAVEAEPVQASVEVEPQPAPPVETQPSEPAAPQAEHSEPAAEPNEAP
jgi:small subunit ribosomal protein S3